MVVVGLEKDWGRLDFFVLPGFRERDFPDWRGRLLTPQDVDENDAVLESEHGKQLLMLPRAANRFLAIGISVFRFSTVSAGKRDCH